MDAAHDARFRLQSVQALDGFAHGRMGGHLVQTPEHGDLGEGHGGTQALPDDPDHDVGALPAPRRHVHLGVGFPADEDVGQLDHALRDVGVDVQLSDDGRLRSHQISNRGQDVGLAVVDPFGRHGAVELQQDPVGR